VRLVAGFYWTQCKTFGLTFCSTRYWNSHRTRLSSLQGSVETLFRWGGKHYDCVWSHISSSLWIQIV